MSYLSERKYSQEEFGDVMAFDNPESQLESLASDRLGGVRH